MITWLEEKAANWTLAYDPSIYTDDSLTGSQASLHRQGSWRLEWASNGPILTGTQANGRLLAGSIPAGIEGVNEHVLSGSQLMSIQSGQALRWATIDRDSEPGMSNIGNTDRGRRRRRRRRGVEDDFRGHLWRRRAVADLLEMNER